MSCVFVAPDLNKYLFYCVVIYTDRQRILYSIHLCSFFLNFNFLPLFSLLLPLSDFRPICLYEFKLNQSAAETTRQLNQVFGNDIVRRWFAKLRSGDFSLQDEPRSGRPTVIQDEDLRTSVETDLSQTMRGMRKNWASASVRFLMVLNVLEKSKSSKSECPTI